jgi:RNA polymerase sigma-70 factor, ECF subfamily
VLDRSHRAAPVPLDSDIEPKAQLEDDALEEREYRLYMVGRALQLLETDFEPTTWKACWETVVEGRPAKEVAEELGLSINAVYLAKSRALSRLRTDLDGLLD